MKTKHIFYSIIALAGATFASCKKDYLDVVPTDRVADVTILSDSSLFNDYVINREIGRAHV